MSALTLDFEGADVLLPEGLARARVSVADGLFQAEPVGRPVDARGFVIVPGIVDAHGDGFELHLAPRRGVMPDMADGVISTEAILASNGITTAVMAQFFSWEGGLRGPDYAERVFAAINAARPRVATDLMIQLRFETHMLDDYARLPDLMSRWDIPYLVFNDHLPHDRLAAGRRPARLTGQALKAGRDPEAHLAMLTALHSRTQEVPAALDALCTKLLACPGLRIGSHDDASAAMRHIWHDRGVRIAEFPETQDAAQRARELGDGVIIGAPNVVRGSSHKRNVSGRDLVAAGLCDALASDYHYPSLRRAVLTLVESGICDLATGWRLVSEGPARVLGLPDRGRIAPGLRADCVFLDASTYQVAATFAGGRVSYLSGEMAARLVA